MSLGFNVESLLPKARGGKVLTMGLQRIDEGDWLRPEADIAARRAILDEFPESISVLPEAAEAGREVAGMLGVEGGLGAAARAVWEDLCILTTDGDSDDYRLTGGAVGFPTDWRLADKMGLPLTSVHGAHTWLQRAACGRGRSFYEIDEGWPDLWPGELVCRAE